MAGSFAHVVNADGSYRGAYALDTMGDMVEAIDEMAFILILFKQRWPLVFDEIQAHYYRCARQEEDFPDWFEEGHNALS